jgi:tetratricopeptide (TPR) repeat protein
MYLDEKAYTFANKILDIYHPPSTPPSTPSPPTQPSLPLTPPDSKRIIGNTNYKKFEDIATIIDKEEQTKLQSEKDAAEQKRTAMKMGCNNDLRKERQLMDKPTKDKIEASKIFKTEGDDYLKQKQYEEAINAYEKGLLQLFYTFSDDAKEEEESDKMKEAINLNCSFCKINQGKFDEALGYLNEALRINKCNSKAIYRMAFCYFKLEKYNDAIEFANQGMKIEHDSNKMLFQQLLNDIHKQIQDNENAQNKLYKKIMSK